MTFSSETQGKGRGAVTMEAREAPPVQRKYGDIRVVEAGEGEEGTPESKPDWAGLFVDVHSIQDAVRSH